MDRELIAIGVGTAVLVAVGALMVRHSDRKANMVSLLAAPRPVTVVEARAAPYRASRSYVGPRAGESCRGIL